eukprot:TRINITY_DN16133_c1_g1_i1.p1 TRINITY_DN16133_c1_g1~~TRINITY_DN16133_c1_g1_i1.p1  ORF type:complete len:648 (-),score=94.49 TRINITY_DN16133_c1_g1_i1:72-1919(-)
MPPSTARLTASPAGAAAAAAIGAAGTAAVLTLGRNVGHRDRKTGLTSAAVAATAAALGGVGGYTLWKLSSRSEPTLEQVLDAIDTVHAAQPRSPEDVLNPTEYCREVERCLFLLWGGPAVVSSALRIAARAQRFNEHSSSVRRIDFSEGLEGYHAWRAQVKTELGKRLIPFLKHRGVNDVMSARVESLLFEDGDASPERNVEMRTLEDAVALVFFSHELPALAADVNNDAKFKLALAGAWKKLGRPAQARVLTFDYTPSLWGSLLEAIAIAEGLESTTSPMVAPRLPATTISILRDTWARIPQDTFGQEVLERLYAEDDQLKAVFDPCFFRPSNMWKAVDMLLNMLDAPQVPRLERVAHAVAALGHQIFGLCAKHLVLLKRAIVRSVLAHTHSDKKTVSRVWEAFFYSVTAVMAPYLVLADSLPDLAAATASPLATPGGGPHAGAIAAQGIGLLEMSLTMTELCRGGTPAPAGLVNKLYEARSWLIESVRNDVNAYCGLLASVYADTRTSVESKLVEDDESERRRWQRKAAEVPSRIAEVSMGVAIECLPCPAQIRTSLQGDWAAGAILLRTAFEISVRNAHSNIRESPKGLVDLEQRIARLVETEAPWEKLTRF